MIATCSYSQADCRILMLMICGTTPSILVVILSQVEQLSSSGRYIICHILVIVHSLRHAICCFVCNLAMHFFGIHTLATNATLILGRVLSSRAYFLYFSVVHENVGNLCLVYCNLCWQASVTFHIYSFMTCTAFLAYLHAFHHPLSC